MNSSKEDNVILVFEPACDAHWMKDVVQFPNAIAQDLYFKNAILITRPNHKQEELSKHINLEYFGEEELKNLDVYKKYNFNEITTDSIWYLQACRKAACMASVLILYPFFGNAFKGAKHYKIKRWLQFRKAFVIVKTDGTLKEMSKRKPSTRQRIRERLKYFFIDKIICENNQVYKDMRMNNTHLSSKLLLVPNCPLDIYHTEKNIPYTERPNKFLFVGRVDDNDKGADVLLEAWMKVALQIPGWQLEIVGPCSHNLKREWEIKLGDFKLINTVLWIGAKDPGDLISHYQSSKIVICSSRRESGPIVLSEAILCGCSFIGTAVGEIPDLLNGLPGIVQGANTLEKQILFFTKHPEIANQQAEALFNRMRDRKWSIQAKRFVDAKKNRNE